MAKKIGTVQPARLTPEEKSFLLTISGKDITAADIRRVTQILKRLSHI